MEEIYLRELKKSDIKLVHKWWNDPENFGATGIEKHVFYEDVLSRFKNRHISKPYEEWFAISVKGLEEPIGIIIIAPKTPKENFVSIGSIIITKSHRRRGYAQKAIKKLEGWVRDNYPGVALSLGVFECFTEAQSFWEACGFNKVETVQTDYIYGGKRQKAYKYMKELN